MMARARDQSSAIIDALDPPIKDITPASHDSPDEQRSRETLRRLGAGLFDAVADSDRRLIPPEDD
jgi:hypothetical protein